MAVQCFLCPCNAGYRLRKDKTLRRICNAGWPGGWSGARIRTITDDPSMVCPWGEHPPVAQEAQTLAAKGW